MHTTTRRFCTSIATAAVAAAALIAPTTAAQAAPLLAHDGAHQCVVTGGVLSWGVKESFRSYISGSIANGSWDTADGAEYSTPLFSWSNPTGEIDAETGEGSVSFAGSLHFTGHDGVLDLTLANPTIVIAGDGTARLLADTRSNDVQGELKIDEQQAYLGKIEGISSTDPTSGEYAFSDAPAILTSEGANAFGDFYASGDPLDPVTLTLQLASCEGDAGAVTSPESAADADEGDDEVIAEITPISAQSGVPWVPIVIGGVALVVIGVTVGMLVAGRKKSGAASQGEDRHAGE